MFERFTASARATVIRAHEEARSSAQDRIDTEHVLVALTEDTGVAGTVLREAGVTPEAVRRAMTEHGTTHDSGLDADALSRIGIDLDDVRRSVEETFGPGALDGPSGPAAGRRRWGLSGHLPFTRAAKRALERGLRAALMLGDPRIGSEHLLLGVLDSGGEAVDRLGDLGVDLDALRATTVARSRRSA